MSKTTKTEAEIEIYLERFMRLVLSFVDGERLHVAIQANAYLLQLVDVKTDANLTDNHRIENLQELYSSLALLSSRSSDLELDGELARVVSTFPIGARPDGD